MRINAIAACGRQLSLESAILLALACAVIFAMASSPRAESQGTTGSAGSRESAVQTGLGPGPVLNWTDAGLDFVTAGATTRIFNPASGTSQTNPFMLTIPALPPSAVVVDIIAVWQYMLNGAPPASDGILINGSPVVGGSWGYGTPDICWGKDGVVMYAADGFSFPVGGSPVNIPIANATDKPLGTDLNAYGEGISIIVVYKVLGKPSRHFDFYLGYTSTQTGGTANIADANLTYSGTYTGGRYHFFTNALDGQLGFADDFSTVINFALVVHSGDFNGTVAVGDAFQGLLGPSPSGKDNLYDHVDDDLSPYVFTSPNGIYFQSDNFGTGDCIAHTVAAVSIAVDGCDCLPGDASNDGSIDIGDPVYLISYIFGGGSAPSPYPTCSGDANCDCGVDIGDAVYLIAYIFSGGAPPCACPGWTLGCGFLH